MTLYSDISDHVLIVYKSNMATTVCKTGYMLHLRNDYDNLSH